MIKRKADDAFSITEFSQYRKVAGQYTDRFIKASRCVKVSDSEECVTVAVSDSFRDSIGILRQVHSPKKLKTEIVKDSRFAEFIGRFVENPEEEKDAECTGSEFRLEDINSDAPAVNIINAICLEAIRRNASDIHIQSTKSDVCVRFRIDGVLQTVRHLERSIFGTVVSRIKVMSSLNVKEEDKSGYGASAARYRRTYTWNERNQLISSVDSNCSTAYVYGHDGQRSNKYTQSSETLYFNKMWTLHTDSGNNVYGGQHAKNIYLGETRIVTKLNSGSNPTYQEEYYKQYFYHSDHLGSASLISDYKGDEYQRIEYTPYGETWVEKTQNTGLEFLPYKFTAKELDAETGLYYYGSRYLDPRYSRWISTDPALGEYIPGIGKGTAENFSSLPGIGGVYNCVNGNLYHYAGNNPVKYTDPDGRSSWIKNESFGLIPNQENKIDTSLSKKILGLALIGLGNFLDKGGGAAIAAAVAASTGGTGAIAAPAIVTGSETLGAYLEIAGAAIFLESCVENISNSNVNFSSSGDSHNKEKKPTSQNQMQNQVKRGQAPKDVDRVDKAHNNTGKPHVHFKDGTSLNQDGTVHDAHKGTPNPSNEVKQWLSDNGWSTGE